MLSVLFLATMIQMSNSIVNDFMNCQDDTNRKIADGMLEVHVFNWLAFVQYVHVTTNLVHHSKAPRVVLIQKQFALGTAQDLLQLPKNYKLGNVVFGQYEREEDECGLTLSQIKLGLVCPRAYLEMPYADIIPHPEFTRFGVGNSLAVIKFIRPIRSNYMVPLCFPTVMERERMRRKKTVYMIDYISSVPRDFNTERMAKKTFKLFTHKECRQHRMRSRLGSEGVTHVLCTSGCGVRSGAPIVVHARDGPWELVGLAASSPECTRRSQRKRLLSRPPIYIDVYPYYQWITNVMTANIMPMPYPNNFMLTSSGGMALQMGKTKKFARITKLSKPKEGWRARTYVAGKMCFNKPRSIRKMDWVYEEKFETRADPPGKMNVYLKIIADYECKIKCVKVQLPNRQVVPTVFGVNRHNVSVEFHSNWFPFQYHFTISLFAKNATEEEMYHWAYGFDDEEIANG